MDGATAEVIQTAIIAGMGTIIAAIVIGVRSWVRVELAKSESQRGVNRETLAAVESLRKEVEQLRDTTTRYDLSFDTALQRLEARMGHLESLRSGDQETETMQVQSAGRV
jgi:hypothetical protein